MKAKIKAYDNSIISACDEILEKQGYNKDRFKGLSPQATVRNNVFFIVLSGVGISGTHQNLKILGTAEYRVPRKFKKWDIITMYSDIQILTLLQRSGI